MLSKFNFGFFLRTIYPHKRRDYSRDYFLDDLFYQLIRDKKIKNKSNSTFSFSRELTSRLISNQVDLPNTFQKAISDECFFDKKYISASKPYFNKLLGSVNIYKVCVELLKIISCDENLDKKHYEVLSSFLAEKEYYSILWYLACLASLLPNRNGSETIRPQGRPRKKHARDSFFYLSQKEKENRAEYFINHLKNRNVNLELADLQELLEILAYCKPVISFEDKVIICENFFKRWKKEKGPSRLTVFLEYFSGARMTFTDRTKNFDGWEKPSHKAYANLMIDILKERIKIARKTKDYYSLSKLFYDEIFNNSFYKYDDYFLKQFRHNNYFLSDFKNTINQSIWTYCHNVAEFCGKTDLAKSFQLYILDIKNNNLDNPTIVDRCEGLIDRCNAQRR